MIPDLDRYADTILAAYGVTFVLLGLLILFSWRRAAKVRRELAEFEAELRGKRDDAA